MSLIEHSSLIIIFKGVRRSCENDETNIDLKMLIKLDFSCSALDEHSVVINA